MDGHRTLHFSERCLLTVGLLIMMNFEAAFWSGATADFQDPIARPSKAAPLQMLPRGGAERRQHDQDPWLLESLKVPFAAEHGKGVRKQQAQAAASLHF